MEKKQRVPKGKYYWFIDEVVGVNYDADNREVFSTRRYLEGNYFHTKEEAEAMARKLRAVLKGAEVIEMPSEEDSETFAVELARRNAFVSETFTTAPDWRMAARLTFEWLKSKIVK